MRSDRDRLADMLEALDRVLRYRDLSREDFQQDEVVQTWVIHYVQIVGEAARALSEEFISAHPDIPWSDIIGMRHSLVHHYFSIDLDAVVEVMHRDAPLLREQVRALLAAMPEEGTEPL